MKYYNRDNEVTVQNAPDTSKLTTSHERGWLGWWKEQKGLKQSDIIRCVRCDEEEATDGGHVWDGKALPLYIVPLCHSCNDHNDTSWFCVPKASCVEEDESDKRSWVREHMEQ